MVASGIEGGTKATPDISSSRAETAPLTFQLVREVAPPIRLLLKGRMDAENCAAVWPRLEKALRTVGTSPLIVDVQEVTTCDSVGIALLHYIEMGGMTGPAGSKPSSSIQLEGVRSDWLSGRARFSGQDFLDHRPPRPIKAHIAEDVGRGVMALWKDLRDQWIFLLDLISALIHACIHPREFRFREILRVFEKAGADALPIVSLISLLVGLIIAFESAQPLRLFGAEIFIADMIGLVMVRELGPLMTAILLAGRSGSAFAAEIGTMKVNEELNALETMGLSPMRFLVIQRVIASLLLTPMLTAYAMCMGVIGGVLVMVSLGFPLPLIFSQLEYRLSIGDIAVGISKGFVFGGIVAFMGCLRGLQTQQGPSAVGESTTRAVVGGILMLILADALFSIALFQTKG